MSNNRKNSGNAVATLKAQLAEAMAEKAKLLEEVAKAKATSAAAAVARQQARQTARAQLTPTQLPNVVKTCLWLIRHGHGSKRLNGGLVAAAIAHKPANAPAWWTIPTGQNYHSFMGRQGVRTPVGDSGLRMRTAVTADDPINAGTALGMGLVSIIPGGYTITEKGIALVDSGFTSTEPAKPKTSKRTGK